jgi:hypothetical protein
MQDVGAIPTASTINTGHGPEEIRAQVKSPCRPLGQESPSPLVLVQVGVCVFEGGE